MPSRNPSEWVTCNNKTCKGNAKGEACTVRIRHLQKQKTGWKCKVCGSTFPKTGVRRKTAPERGNSRRDTSPVEASKLATDEAVKTYFIRACGKDDGITKFEEVQQKRKTAAKDGKREEFKSVDQACAKAEKLEKKAAEQLVL